MDFIISRRHSASGNVSLCHFNRIRGPNVPCDSGPTAAHAGCRTLVPSICGFVDRGGPCEQVCGFHTSSGDVGLGLRLGAAIGEDTAGDPPMREK